MITTAVKETGRDHVLICTLAGKRETERDKSFYMVDDRIGKTLLFKP